MQSVESTSTHRQFGALRALDSAKIRQSSSHERRLSAFGLSPKRLLETWSGTETGSPISRYYRAEGDSHVAAALSESS
jgi:hypothetical protein